MRVPKNERELITFARDLIEECGVSRESRLGKYRLLNAYYYTGSSDMSASKHNKVASTLDKLGAYLFSPADVRFSIEFEADETAEWSAMADVAARHLNREFFRRRCGLAFSQANAIGLRKGCAFVKLVHGHSGFEPYVIQPEFMGVLREDIDDLDRQDAFTHSYYLTPAQFRRLVSNHPDKKELLEQVQRMAFSNPTSDVEDSYFHQIVMGGLQPVSVGAAPAQQNMGSVSVFGPPSPMLSPQVATELIRVTDLWVMDDEREDWTTIRYVDPGLIIEGKYQHRNLSDIPNEHPFVKVCANETPGYFWGRSEIEPLANSQDLLNTTVDSLALIMRLQARPPRSFSGFTGITDEKARALLAPGGILTDAVGGQGSVKNEAPPVPQGMMEWIKYIEACFDDSAGFTPTLSGQGDSGIRSGNHASTLMRTSSPRMRDKALSVEEQCAIFGDLCFKMKQAKDARVFKTEGGKQFTLAQLPEDATVRVDSHTSSPAFSGDNMQLMFALAKAGAIEGDSLIETVHPPKEDELLMRFHRKQKAQAEFLQKHPELAQKGGKKH